MAKSAIERMMEAVLKQNALLTAMVQEQQKQLASCCTQMAELQKAKEKEDELSLDDDEPDIPAARHAAQKQQILTLLGRMGEDAHPDMPKFTEFVSERDIDNLKAFSEGMFLHLLRSHFGEAAAEGYLGKRFNSFLFRHIVRYFDMLGDDDALPITDEDRAAAAQEEVRIQEAADAAARERLCSAKGAFSLPGRPELERFFNEQVVNIVTHWEEYEAMGISFPRSFILEGPPGCGKTYAVEKLAEHLNWKTYHLTAESIGSTYVHGTAVKTSKLFEEAAENAPALIIIDEMEGFLPPREADVHHHVTDEVDCFLQLLQTAAEKKILVVGMTNHLNRVDSAVLRTGRMGTHIKVGMPSPADILTVLKTAVEKRPHAEGLDYDGIVARLADHPLSDVTFVADEAAMTAVRSKHPRIEQADLECALTRLLTTATTTTAPRRPLGFHG